MPRGIARAAVPRGGMRAAVRPAAAVRKRKLELLAQEKALRQTERYIIMASPLRYELVMILLCLLVLNVIIMGTWAVRMVLLSTMIAQ